MRCRPPSAQSTPRCNVARPGAVTENTTNTVDTPAPTALPTENAVREDGIVRVGKGSVGAHVVPPGEDGERRRCAELTRRECHSCSTAPVASASVMPVVGLS